MRRLGQTPMVQIYGQPYQHQDAEIVGNRAGLEALRDAINRALGNGLDEAEVFCHDGEGYGIVVLELCDALMGEMPLPYTDADYGLLGAQWPDVVLEVVNDWRREQHGKGVGKQRAATR